MNNNPFGINPQQLLSMLGGNMDMSGLGNLLSAMNKNGFDLNSLNNFNGTSNNPINDKSNPTPHKEKSDESENLESTEDDNIQFLESLRKIVDINKIDFIDRIIELYNKGVFKDKFE
jgi:predicted transcriptional regulator YheO